MQIFHPRMTLLGRVAFVGVPLMAVVFGTMLAYGTEWSSWETQRFVTYAQPVPFSHEHHVGGLGIDCRFCHQGADESSFAGMPTTKVCMTCHTQIWQTSGMLEPVRASWYTRQPIEWTRVHDLPDYVYFNHEIHAIKGVGCSECHGDVGQMRLMRRENNLQMRWCLNCHEDVKKVLRPQEAVFDPTYVHPANQAEIGARLAAENHIRTAAELTNCSTCHR